MAQFKAKTVGGVVGDGQPILDIVPKNDELLIKARIAPTEIDVVRSDLPAQVVSSAFTQRSPPRLAGRVRDVSADRFTDLQSTSAFYLARVEVDRVHIRDVAPELELTAGPGRQQAGAAAFFASDGTLKCKPLAG